jgi:hypothetical protein
MKTFKVTISGVTPHLIHAKNKRNAIRNVRQKWSKQIAISGDFDVVEWKPYTVDSLIAELRQFAGSTPVCFPASGGTSDAQFLPVIMGVSAVETVPSFPLYLGIHGKGKTKTMICFESRVISSNVS